MPNIRTLSTLEEIQTLLTLKVVMSKSTSECNLSRRQVSSRHERSATFNGFNHIPPVVKAIRELLLKYFN